MRTLIGIVLTLGAIPSISAAEMIWIEAEQFEQLGGWVNDAQFVDQMGSPYLLAGGFGSPVDDAVTRVEVADGGAEYRLWTRTKDWFPAAHPGPFQVLLGGDPVAMTFGQSGQTGWRWEDGGIHRLGESVEIRLHDLTGYYGRCDALVLTTDLAWRPPAEVEEIAELRRQLGGQSADVETLDRFDVVVVGGGLAGCTAAVAASRNGMRVALIQNRPVLGGNASTEILVPPVGASAGAYRRDFPLDPRETGFLEEYRTAGNQRVVEGKLYSQRLDRFVRQEPKLDLFLNTHATGVEMQDDGRIGTVLAMDVTSGRRLRFPGVMFLDCSGDSAVSVAAGADYRHGKEPRSMYDEPWAPDEPSPHTMGNGLKYAVVHTGEPQPWKAPPWAYKFDACEDFGEGRHPRLADDGNIGYQWQIELGGLRDTYADAEEIRDDLFRLIFGLWDHTKNHCDKLAEDAADCRLAWVGYVAGKRENRRLLGDYVLTQNDIGQQRVFPDRVAFGAWSVDDHYSGGFFYDGATAQHLDRPEHHYKGVPYTIPFRCLYSRNVENLMMAGRNISASHLGMSNARVMLTCATLGHATGTGAAMCIARQTTPRGLLEGHLADLQQQLLKEGAPVLQLANADPRDLSRVATATASSHRVHESGDAMVAANVNNGLARAEGKRLHEVTNAWGPDEDAPGPHWVELAWDEPVRLNTVHISFQTVDTAPYEFAVLAWRDGDWVALAELDDNRHRRHVLGVDETTTTRLRVTIEEASAISEIRVYQEPPEVVAAARRAHATMRTPDVGPWLPWGEVRPPLTVRGSKLPGFVLEAEYGQQRGTWVGSTWSEPFIGSQYLHDGDTRKGGKSLRFPLDGVPSGRYEIRLAYKAYQNRAANVPVLVTSRDGTARLEIDQRKDPPIDGLFYPLGTYTIDDQSAVEIRNEDTEGYVVVDALQLLPVE